jgi:hypothetical protein
MAELVLRLPRQQDVGYKKVEYEWICKRRNVEEMIYAMVVDKRVPCRLW